MGGREEGSGPSLNKMVRKAMLGGGIWNNTWKEVRGGPMCIWQQNLLGSGTGKHRPGAAAGWAHRSNSKEAVRHGGPGRQGLGGLCKNSSFILCETRWWWRGVNFCLNWFYFSFSHFWWQMVHSHCCKYASVYPLYY